MTVREFQEEVLLATKHFLSKGDVTLSRLSEIATGALDVSRESRRGISQKALGSFLNDYPECARFFKKKVEQEEEENREAVLKRVRSNIATS